METPPIVQFTDKDGISHITNLNSTICSLEYEIFKSKTKLSWAYEYNFYCDALYLSFLNLSFFVGTLIGAIGVQLGNKYGSTKLFYSILLSYSFLGLFFIGRNKILLILEVLFSGIVSYGIFILRMVILTEITNNKHRSYYFLPLNSAQAIVSIMILFFFRNNIHWSYYYSGSFILSFIIGIACILFLIENPRYYYVKNDKENFIKSVNSILNFNGLSTNSEIKIKVDSIIHSLFDSEDHITKHETNTMPSMKKVETEHLNQNEDKLDPLINTSETKDILIVTDNTKQSNNSKYFSTFFNNLKSLFIALGIYISFALLINIMFLETKNFTYELDNIAYISYAVSFLLQTFVSFLMNVKYIGRKYTLLFCVLTNILMICIAIFDDAKGFMVYNFLIRRMMYLAMIPPLVTLINESFSTEYRLKYVGIIMTIAKLCVFAVPFVFQYLEEIYHQITLITAVILAILSLFLKETLNSKLFDKE